MSTHERAVELVRREAVHFQGRVRYVEGMLEAGAVFPPVSEGSRNVADAWTHALRVLEAYPKLVAAVRAVQAGPLLEVRDAQDSVEANRVWADLQGEILEAYEMGVAA